MGHRNLIAQSGWHCWPRVWFCISLNQLKLLLFLPHDYTSPLTTLTLILAFIWLLLLYFHLCWGFFEPVAVQPACLGLRHVWHSAGQAHIVRDRQRLCLQTPLPILLGHVTRLDYDSDTCDLTGTLLFRRGRLLLPSTGEIKTTMTVTGSLRYLPSCYYFLQLIDIKYFSVRLPSPIIGLQAVRSLTRLWCHTFRLGLSRNDR